MNGRTPSTPAPALRVPTWRRRLTGPLLGIGVLGVLLSSCGDQTVCMVWGPGGEDLLEASAPGFRSAQRTVTVPETVECGCHLVTTQRVQLSLVRN